MSKKPKELLPTVQLLTLKEPLLCQELQVTEELVAALRQKGFTVSANVLKVGHVCWSIDALRSNFIRTKIKPISYQFVKVITRFDYI